MIYPTENILINLTLTIVALGLLSSHGAQAQENVHREPSHAVTLWWVVFNEPANCYGSTDPSANCSSADVFGPAFLESVNNGKPNPSLIAPNLDSGVAVLYATGGTTGTDGDLNLTAALYRSSPGVRLDLPPGVDPMGFGRGLENDGAEIHLVVRDHGDVSPRGLIAQTTNFLDPYCSDPNLLYISGPNLCIDAQFAVFGSGESGSDAMYAFSNPYLPIRGARVHLSRRDNVVRAVVRTRLNPPDYAR